MKTKANETENNPLNNILSLKEQIGWDVFYKVDEIIEDYDITEILEGLENWSELSDKRINLLLCIKEAIKHKNE